MAEKMHASLDNWLGGDDALLKKLRKQVSGRSDWSVEC